MPESHDPGLNELVAALAALRPNPPTLDRDRLLFRAGRASAPRPWFWRLATVASTTVAAVLAGVLTIGPAPPPVEHVIYVQVQPPPAPPKNEVPPAPPAPLDAEPPVPYPRAVTPYARMEEKVLRLGLDGLAEPTPPPDTEPPVTLDSLLRSL